MRLSLLSVAYLASMSDSTTGFVAPRTFHSTASKTTTTTTSIASSMEEYEKQLQATSMGGSGVASPAPAPAPVEAVAAPVSAPADATGGGGSSTPSSAIDTLAASQTADIDRIAAAIGADLVANVEASWTSETVGGSAATIDGREAPGSNGNIAWLANTVVKSKLVSLTIFNGPLTDVPHLLSQVSVVDDDKLRFTLDFRPRAYGAYEKRNADGTYPGPEELGREAFTYSGNRKDFDTKFGTPEVSAFVAGIASSLEDANAYSLQPTELDQLIRGPLYLDEVCALTEANLATIATARSQAVDYWLGWCMDSSHEHRPGAPINAQYVYDEKFRINAYQALLENYKTVFGADGQKIAAADSGPLGEAYVGGGS